MLHTMNVLVFCRIPLADIVTDLKLFLLLWHICDAIFMHILSCFCSLWSVLVLTVCMLVAHISITTCYVLITTCAFGFSNGSL